MTDLDAHIARIGRNGRSALATMEITAQLARAAKQPGFRMDAWDELAAFYDVAVFRRIAANREARDWHEDVRLRHQFALVAAFDYEIRRIAEAGNRVYMDTVETIETARERFSVYTLAVMEFDEAGLITSTKTWQQWDPERVPGHVGRPENSG